jgi:S1-C subfamily serine protease
MPRFQDVNFEFSARDLSFFDRAREQLPDDIRGALVSEVKDGGWAALGELQVNDIIQTVAGRSIADADALAAAMSALVKQRADRVLVVVRRGIRTLYLELEPSWRDDG